MHDSRVRLMQEYQPFVIAVVDGSISLFRVLLETMVLCWGPRQGRLELRKNYLDINSQGISLSGLHPTKRKAVYREMKYFPVVEGLNEIIL